MTGPEHYREAERLLHAAHAAQLEAASGAGERAIARAARATARAQVHATLALAAAAWQGHYADGGVDDFGRLGGAGRERVHVDDVQDHELAEAGDRG